MLSSLSALLTRHTALATSVALHLGVVAVGGHAFSRGSGQTPGPSAPTEIEVQIFDASTAPSPNLAAASPMPDNDRQPQPPARAAGTGHRHAYPVAPDHDARPHDPSLVHVAGRAPDPPSEAPTVSEATPSQADGVTTHTSEAPSVGAPPRFVLGSAGLATHGTTASGATAFAGASGAPNGAGAGAAEAPLAESAVDQPARLLASAPVAYPEPARAAGVEADVLLELIVDSGGRVTNARQLSGHELGLTEAAVRAVRAYRFTPARRAGRAVAVRMRWTITFRLR